MGTNEVVIVGILGFFIGLSVKKRKVNPQKSNRSEIKIPHKSVSIPSDMGIKKGTNFSEALHKLRRDLEDSLDDTYMENVKNRVLKHTNWNDNQYNLYLYGLKQFFLMNAILKSVPMFSEGVDEIWHEMLMFTREYQNFSKQFIGDILHHAPNTSKEASHNYNTRAEFDWFYNQLFDINEASLSIYKSFFDFNIDKERQTELTNMTEESLKTYFFKHDSQLPTT